MNNVTVAIPGNLGAVTCAVKGALSACTVPMPGTFSSVAVDLAWVTDALEIWVTDDGFVFAGVA